ncbi:transposase [Rhodovibrio salinarum]|uniref:transposase n=1 Tax=Rhodovibrio salinarum TaxID=1087 RepID=UPI0004AF6E46|nr:transposase [Rhodovibrio salinarum]
MSVLITPYFHDDIVAFANLEAIMWPKGPVCPHCDSMENIYKIDPTPEKKVRMVRMGLHKYGHGHKQFTVKVGTVLESSHTCCTSGSKRLTFSDPTRQEGHERPQAS